MQKVHRRSKFELYGDILLAIRADIGQNNSARLTRVHGRSNVPYDRFKDYLSELEEKRAIEIAIVDNHEEIKLTDRGLEYLEEYARVNRFLIDFGLQEKRRDLE